jgi:Uma2 family endonuclease
MIVRTLERDMAVSIPPDAHTLPGFRAWVASGVFPQRGCISLIDGTVIVDMSAERAGSHNAVKTEVVRALDSLVRELDLGVFYSDGMWITNDEAGLSNEPDALFASWEGFECGRIELIAGSESDEDGAELRGCPDWVLEIVSPSSVQKDTMLLPAAYYRAGVREYWLIDARGDSLQFTVFARGAEEFLPAPPREGWAASEVFGREFRLDRGRDRIGGWRYTLHVREA